VYKYLLCWRYLLTRYLALACVVSVMLGVATLIVVNSVMAGFSTKLKDRLHGLLSDVLVESPTLEGFPDAQGKMERIRRDPFLKDKIAAMTATMEVFAMLQFNYRGEMITRPVRLIGIDPGSRAQVGGFAEHLVNQKNSPSPTFALGPQARERYEEIERLRPRVIDLTVNEPKPGEPPPPDPPPSTLKVPAGIIVGHAIASYRARQTKADAKPKDIILLEPGDDVILTTVSGQRLAPVYDRFVICDYFKSEMSEYDANYVFVPLDTLQKLRTMDNRATSIQLRLNDYRDAESVVKSLETLFPSSLYHVETWEDKQGPLLAAIAVEKGILNVLLFLIICVAGFGILAIFTMIVVEKTRDIGILKALGASNGGVMKIFLGYGLLLGLVGAGLGTTLGLTFTTYINPIEQLLGKVTGQVIFPRDVYYFDKIPTFIQPQSVMFVNLGAIAIAVLFSVLPALRAALLHPVRALRYE
jgi:lipoprotein-releasing system permease protein